MDHDGPRVLSARQAYPRVQILEESAPPPPETGYLANRSTAEVITEPPSSLPLANYGTASYTNAQVNRNGTWIQMTPSLPILNDESCLYNCQTVTQYASAVDSSGNLSTTWNNE